MRRGAKGASLGHLHRSCHLAGQAGRQGSPSRPGQHLQPRKHLSPYFLLRTKAINKVLIKKQP